MLTNDVNRTLDTTSLVTMKGKVVQLRGIKDCRLAENLLQTTTDGVKTMAKYLGSEMTPWTILARARFSI